MTGCCFQGRSHKAPIPSSANTITLRYVACSSLRLPLQPGKGLSTTRADGRHLLALTDREATDSSSRCCSWSGCCSYRCSSAPRSSACRSTSWTASHSYPAGLCPWRSSRRTTRHWAPTSRSFRLQQPLRGKLVTVLIPLDWLVVGQAADAVIRQAREQVVAVVLHIRGRTGLRREANTHHCSHGHKQDLTHGSSSL